ncbi:hypothetical protein [Deminuibacter soli]|uniref:Uncharacterized protein n=1 Tax=Deminuibacter soli TaxID=2291815 RepID=A0A3E1NJG0_9BACT|nr:hypothetical protein [Deminuibacter soli]RFM28063.1 hypothetical protein DXN05_11035 [Deminuibacter soli]
MNLVENKIVQLLTGKPNLQEVSVSELEAITQEQPFFSVAQLLLAKKMKQENHPGFPQQVAKTALYFPNTYWLDHQLNALAVEEPARNFTVSQPAFTQVDEPQSEALTSEETAPLFPEDEATADPIFTGITPLEADVDKFIPAEDDIHIGDAYPVTEPEATPVEAIATEAPEPVTEETTATPEQPVAATTETQEDGPNWSLPTGDLYEEETYPSFNQEAPAAAAPVAEEVPAPAAGGWHFDGINEAPAPQQETSTTAIATTPTGSNWHFDIEEEATAAAESAADEAEPVTAASEPVEEAALLTTADLPAATDAEPVTEAAIEAPVVPVEEQAAGTEAETLIEAEEQQVVTEEIITGTSTETLPGEEETAAHFEQSVKDTFRAAARETPPAADEDQLPVDEIGEKGETGVPNQKLAELLQQQAELYNKPVNAQTELPIETEKFHTVDYFASLGIKMDAEPAESDAFGKKVRKFTDWLKQMKRINPQPKDLGTANEQEQVVQGIAANSNEIKDVVTEAMADVLVKQGKIDKAIQLYSKLSFLNPDKSAYFAAKILALKAT